MRLRPDNHEVLTVERLELRNRGRLSGCGEVGFLNDAALADARAQHRVERPDPVGCMFGCKNW
jgi:hypothetical protein